MKASPKLLIITIFFLLFLSISCEEESLPPNEMNLQEGFALDAFDESITNILSIAWEDYQEVLIEGKESSSRSSDNERWVEYKTSLQGYMTVEDSVNSNGVFFSLVERRIKDSPSEFVLLKFVPSNGIKYGNDVGYFNLLDFSGTIYGFDLNAKLNYALGITMGRLVAVEYTENESRSDSRVQYAPPLPDPCSGSRDPICMDDGGGEDGHWENVLVEIVTDIWFMKAIVGSSNYVLTYGGSEESHEYRQVWVTDPYYPTVIHEHIAGGSAASHGSSVHPNEYLRARRLELESMIAQDPFALITKCNQIEKWQTLAQNEASQEIKSKIDQLQSENNSRFDDWAIQTLNGANGTIVNMDYFSVNVSSLPINPENGQRFTAEGLLDYFRNYINNFVSGSTFGPYCEISALCAQETALWDSENPTGAIVYIDIPGDDGVVICSEYESDYWLFMTLEAPGAGNHPVSGTRQFGFESNSSGGYSFFVRGVDRFDSNVAENALYMASFLASDPGNPFFGADDLWESFQSNMSSFVNTNGGNSSITEAVKYRPDWENVKEILEGERPISDLNCK